MPETEPGPAARGASSGAETWVVLVVSMGLLLLLAAGAAGLTSEFLPPAFASKIVYNSEGYLFAAVLTPWIYFIARQPGTRWTIPVSILLGLLWLTIGLGLLNSSLLGSVKTLNEPAIALGILLPYLTLRRPLARWVPSALVCAILITVGLGMFRARPVPGVSMDSDNWVIYLGEGIFLVLLSVVALDLVERWMLDPSAARLHLVRRALFYAVLVLTPIVVSALGRSARVGDQWSSMSLNYLGRVHEAFVGILLVCGTLLLVSWNERRTRNQKVHRSTPQSVHADDNLSPESSVGGDAWGHLTHTP
ncbi:hypothetical protein NF556_01930 [Ornithinimicrobium faecis]|uniref:Exosortase/archaeosortase family protein n=1 Tax=Ornithinimicrobium faecis TaxID=2934158 RepID=A0ABY4YVP4_9MICO|nr:hypothetical protein [Ornithinimicrobium sp. HY1793]USQ80448.1 hypothetical protein NF556_01930 [Ornithinimicrobium sp. HY1793]